jgi:Fe-Mn family superoxide dismutase
MPQLIHGSNYKENGISEFLSPEAFDFAWTQYQSLMLDKLNLLTEDTVDADLKPADLLVKYSRRAEMASVFNHASMAHNNHFFFNCLVNIIRIYSYRKFSRLFRNSPPSRPRSLRT